jgi:FMN phosphatase YigB (HAD superfamily)
MFQPAQALIATLEDVVYPHSHYGERACRAGSDLLSTLLGIDVYEALAAYYVPGAEELAVRAALEEGFKIIDSRLVAKIAAAMCAHAPRLSPYEDAEEVFAMLQGMGMPLGLIVDGPPSAQRQLVKHLKIDRIFSQIVYAGELRGEQPLMDSLNLMELLLDCDLGKTSFVCARAVQAKLAAGLVGRIFRVFRTPPNGHRQSARRDFAGVIPMLNLYELPEALGLVAWSE